MIVQPVQIGMIAAKVYQEAVRLFEEGIASQANYLEKELADGNIKLIFTQSNGVAWVDVGYFGEKPTLAVGPYDVSMLYKKRAYVKRHFSEVEYGRTEMEICFGRMQWEPGSLLPTLLPMACVAWDKGLKPRLHIWSSSWILFAESRDVFDRMAAIDDIDPEGFENILQELDFVNLSHYMMQQTKGANHEQAIGKNQGDQ